ncbi:acyl carrier protein [Candidatus Woesearchaeota archaeon]|nr:MAG: acyl carrier protein [Candidatus Woesearchaeota archaeon]
MQDVEKKFKEIVADIFRVKVSEIKDSTRFVEDLNAKSIDIIALIAATENTFGIHVPAQEASKNKTVGQAIEYIKRKLREKSSE